MLLSCQNVIPCFLTFCNRDQSLSTTAVLRICSHIRSYVHYIFTGNVSDSDSFFLYESGVPVSTRESSYVPLFERPPVDIRTEMLINETCGDNSECAYDIAVTGNVDVGRETLVDIEEHMMIVNQTLPSTYEYSCIPIIYVYIRAKTNVLNASK